jgi:anti-sigma regulatory factor (Ser/Thr protein kinase)
MSSTVTCELSASCRFDPEPSQVRNARDWAFKALVGWGLAEHAELVELLVSELVTNAIVHGDGPVDLCLSCASGDLWIEVRDEGIGLPVLCWATAEDMSGRGLALVDALTISCGGTWGVTHSSSGQPGKNVYAVVPLPRANQGMLMSWYPPARPPQDTPGPAATVADPHPGQDSSLRNEIAGCNDPDDQLPGEQAILPAATRPISTASPKPAGHHAPRALWLPP